jgi:hypothetical protein
VFSGWTSQHRVYMCVHNDKKFSGKKSFYIFYGRAWIPILLLRPNAGANLTIVTILRVTAPASQVA